MSNVLPFPCITWKTPVTITQPQPDRLPRDAVTGCGLGFSPRSIRSAAFHAVRAVNQCRFIIIGCGHKVRLVLGWSCCAGEAADVDWGACAGAARLQEIRSYGLGGHLHSHSTYAIHVVEEGTGDRSRFHAERLAAAVWEGSESALLVSIVPQLLPNYPFVRGFFLSFAL